MQELGPQNLCLNPRLYAALVRASKAGPIRGFLPGVRVSKRGMANMKRHTLVDGKATVDIVSAGEEYQVCCPFCRDSRHRLSFNYEWGVLDQASGQPLNHLVHCYNEQCEKRVAGFYRNIWDRVQFADMQQKQFGIPVSELRMDLAISRGDVSKIGVEWPGTVTDLRDLPGTHPAVKFLNSRGYRPDVLADRYGCRYCIASRKHPMARGRLVFPVRAPLNINGSVSYEMVGYQARYVGNGSGKPPSEGGYKIPKWWTCPGFLTGSHLYNLFEAKVAPGADRMVVVVEGPFDVCNVGAPGDRWSPGPVVATFGKTLSGPQMRLLAESWAGKAVAVAYDPEVFTVRESQLHLQQTMSRMRESGVFAAVVPVVLPEGIDPGGVPEPEVFWELVEESILGGGKLG